MDWSSLGLPLFTLFVFILFPLTAGAIFAGALTESESGSLDLRVPCLIASGVLIISIGASGLVFGAESVKGIWWCVRTILHFAGGVAFHIIYFVWKEPKSIKHQHGTCNQSDQHAQMTAKQPPIT